MTRNDDLDATIEAAAERIGAVWPLHSFVTANPLAGFEDRPFPEAVAAAERLFGGRGYPHPSVFRRAWEKGRIDPDVLADELAAHGIDRDPETLLDEMTESESGSEIDEDTPETETLDRVLSKWLAAFLDHGHSTWSMPNRDRGFYAAWRELAPHDDEVPGCTDPSDLPESSGDALVAVLSRYPEERREAILEHHLAALPGWTGFIKQRADGDATGWQSTAPISLADYLAVRLTLADLLDAPVEPPESSPPDDPDETPLAEIWLTAWEKSYRSRLLDDIESPAADSETAAVESSAVAAGSDAAADGSRPAAQLVFCIDTRSEVIRRHVESVGPYETHGYAGFFGIPMRYQGYDGDVEIDACPPIVEPQHRIAEEPVPERRKDAQTYTAWSSFVSAGRKHLKSLKSNLAAAFTFVEGGGSAYGAAMAIRTLLPSTVYDAAEAVDELVPRPGEFCAPTLDHQPASGDALPQGLTLAQKVAYAETAFELMGWEEFARLVVFTGHASRTANNPFDSSLDCGACAGNPGGPNARVLAAICNDEDVRSALRERGYDIPADTVFLAAEHNTTTDAVTLFDDAVPASHQEDLARLREDLAEAQAAAAAERTDSMSSEATEGVREVQRRAADWAETRPEWGLAGNASFVIGPRELTADSSLDGRAFLHSYDWTTDPEGEALESIMTGPLVVTQWINNQYYFATVDNAVYGSGSKTTQNPVGNVGVYQGNGGDLMTGLPLQSLYADDDRPYHQPLRLTAVIHAPVERVAEILRRHDHVARLFDNGWLRLTVMDPTQAGEFLHYQGDGEWEPAQGVRPAVASTAPEPSSAD